MRGFGAQGALARPEAPMLASHKVPSLSFYRVMAPWQMTDPNGDRGAARFDALGRVVATAVMGKVGSTDGDTLEDPPGCSGAMRPNLSTFSGN